MKDLLQLCTAFAITLTIVEALCEYRYGPGILTELFNL